MPTDYNNILIELNKTVKILKFYPKGHPNLDDALEQCYAVIKEGLDSEGEFRWRVDQNGFYVGDRAIAPAHSPAATFAKQFFLRSVKLITFSPNLNTIDIQELMSLLMMDPKEIKDKGGAEKIMISEGATGILLNDMNYEDALEIQEEIEEEVPVEEELMEEEIEEIEEIEEVEEIEHLDAQEVKNIDELLLAIQKEEDLLRYQDLCVRITEMAKKVAIAQEFDKNYEILRVINHEIHTLMQKSPEIRNLAIETIEGIINRGILDYMIAKLANRNDKELTVLRQIIAIREYDGMEALLDMLIDDDSSHLRRAIYDTLVIYGEKVRPHLNTRLSDPRWFVVRQVASLLGELGGKESLDKLEYLYNHEDKRVRREVLKSLSRIRSVRSKDILMSALLDRDQAIKSQAMISLGMLKDESAIDTIGEIITAKSHASDGSMEMQKEGIKALGIIGDAKAVPYLEKVVLKSAWFEKDELNDLKAIAVTSLGKIGTDDAINIVHKAYKGSSGKLLESCKRVIEGIKKS